MVNSGITDSLAGAHTDGRGGLDCFISRYSSADEDDADSDTEVVELEMDGEALAEAEADAEAQTWTCSCSWSSTMAAEGVVLTVAEVLHEAVD
jgi:hypothetical protein